jgi:hypothetical protein
MAPLMRAEVSRGLSSRVENISQLYACDLKSN